MSLHSSSISAASGAEKVMPPGVFIGCAGWSIPREEKALFPDSGTHLERYAARFSAVEINSSFYRPHRTATYARWAASVPENFRFSVKMPKAITHEARLEDTSESLKNFSARFAASGTSSGPCWFSCRPAWLLIAGSPRASARRYAPSR